MTSFVGILMTLFSDSFVLLRDCRGNCMDSTKKYKNICFLLLIGMFFHEVFLRILQNLYAF